METTKRAVDPRTVGAALMALAGLGMLGYAVAFLLQSFTGLIELGFSPAQAGATQEQIRAFSPGVYNYISHVQIALGGFIAATGLAVAFMAWYGVRQGESWAWWGVVLTTALWAVLATPFHYVYGLGTLAHLWPTYLALLAVAVGAYLARPT